MAAGKQTPEIGRWIMDLAAAHRTFADQLTDRQSLTIPSQDPDYGGLGQAFPPWPGPGNDAILQPPKPEIRPSRLAQRRAAGRLGKSPDRQVHVLAELLVQFLSGSGGPGCQPDRKRWLAALVHLWHGVLHQGTGLLITQPGQDYLEHLVEAL